MPEFVVSAEAANADRRHHLELLADQAQQYGFEVKGGVGMSMLGANKPWITVSFVEV